MPHDEITSTEQIMEKPSTESVVVAMDEITTKKPFKGPTRKKKKKTKPTTTTTMEPEVEEPEEEVAEEESPSVQPVVEEENSENEVSPESEEIDCSDNDRDFVPSDIDCKTYYRCVYNKPMMFICKEEGTVYHTQLNVCVWPRESDRKDCMG